jgi:hypothetical protein
MDRRGNQAARKTRTLRGHRSEVESPCVEFGNQDLMVAGDNILPKFSKECTFNYLGESNFLKFGNI